MDIQALPACPSELAATLADLDATVARVTDHAPRYHVRLHAPSGPLFAWYSEHPDDEEALRHEVAVRRAVGTDGVLRAPVPLAVGRNWRVERMVVPDPLGGEALDLVVEAWRRLATLDLPRRPSAPSPGSRSTVARRRARLLASPLPVRDLLRARRMAAASSLPRVTTHGDFHPAHVLPAGGAVWLIDWELSGKGPLGLDLMQLWCGLADEAARGRLLDAALGAVQADQRADVLRLRYVALVQRIASKLAEVPRFGNRDPVEAQALLALLPQVRAAALG